MLTEAQRAEVSRRLLAEGADRGLVPWPNWAPRQYNGSGTPCDMWSGPCSCGATHRDGR